MGRRREARPPFAAHVHTDAYHVFLTEHDDHTACMSTARTAGFTVQAARGGEGEGEAGGEVSGTFSWRVVAKRNDIAGERLPVWEMPTAPVFPPSLPRR